MTMTEFLEARIVEDELLAAPDPGWDDYKGHCDAVGVHYDNSRVLAECAAKRAILDMHAGYAAAVPESVGIAFVGARSGQEVAADALKALAAVYKDHPDYQQEWAV